MAISAEEARDVLANADQLYNHAAVEHAIAFAELAHAKHLVTFHHDPAHDDDAIDRLTAEAIASMGARLAVTAGAEGATFEL